MKRKGFTLVELLAVIAILAILVIIALPNVMKLFNNSKKDLFVTEIRELHHMASHDWIVDSISLSGSKTYIQTKEECSNCKKIDANVRDDLEYEITIDSNGSITKFYATDGSYQFGYAGEGLTVKEITGDVVYNVSDLEPIEINGVASIKNTKLQITANGNNIDNNVSDDSGETDLERPGGTVSISYYDGDRLVDRLLFMQGSGTKYFANYSCDLGSTFQHWRTEDLVYTFVANQEITDEIIANLGYNINLYAVCKRLNLENPGHLIR